MAETSVGVGGVWKEWLRGGAGGTGCAVGVSSAWKTIAKGWVGVSGVWKQFYQNAVYSVAAGTSISDSFFGGAFAGITFESDGDIISTVTTGSSDIDDWVAPKSLAPGAYTIRAHLASGTSPDGAALDSDLALTSDRSWSLTQVGVGSKTCTLTLTLKDGGGNTLATGDVTLTATGV